MWVVEEVVAFDGEISMLWRWVSQGCPRQEELVSALDLLGSGRHDREGRLRGAGSRGQNLSIGIVVARERRCSSCTPLIP